MATTRLVQSSARSKRIRGMDKELNPASQQDAAAGTLQNGRRRKLLAAVLGVFAAAGIAYGAYWMLVARYGEYTDNAYVNGNVVQITPQVSGTVVSIGADDTEFVKAGQTLVQLDK